MAMRGVPEHPAGLRYQEGLVTAREETELLSRFAGLEMEPVVMHGVASRRQVRHFGLTYDFDSWATASAEPIPDYLLQLRAAAALVARTEPTALVEALVTRYPPGAGIGWPRDAPSFGPVVVGVSLGADSVLRFQRRGAGGGGRGVGQALGRRG